MINTKSVPSPFGPYSQAIDTGSMVFISAQLPICPNTKIISDNISDQTYQSLRNIKSLTFSVGLQIINIVKVTLFIINIDDLPLINVSYERFFRKYSDHNKVNDDDLFSEREKLYLPARSCVEVIRLPKDVKIIIEAILARL